MASSDSDSVLLNQIVDQGVNIYGSREKIRSALIESAKDYLNLKDSDLTKTSYLAYLIDQLSILSANHLFYDSTIYKEFFFTDAQMSESVYNLAKWIGYSIPKATPATLNVMFAVPLNFSTYNQVTFSIPPYFYVYANKIKFLIKNSTLDTDNSGTFHADMEQVQNLVSGKIINNSVLNVKDYNGFYRPVYLSDKDGKAYFTLPFEQKEIIFNTYKVPGDLTANQFYNIPVTFDGQVCDIDIFVISPSHNQKLVTAGTSIDGVLDAATFNPSEVIYDSSGSVCSWTKWEEAAHGIYTMHSRANQYTWVGGYNKGEIMFGNGILGKQPPPNSIIAVRLHVTKGSSGNIIANTLTHSDTVYANVGNKVTSISFDVSNPNAAFGGVDLLTLPEIKQNAITNLSAKKRLVSEEDYNNLQTIMGSNVPLADAYSILKRSDIKVNEIMTFTTLKYTVDNVPEIVPTRNSTLTIKNPNWDEEGKLTILRNTIADKTNSNVNEPFYTMFNMTLDKKLKTAKYDYILQNLKGSSVKMYAKLKDNFYDQFCYIVGNDCNFGIDINKKTILTDDYPLNIRFAVNHIANHNHYVDVYKNVTDTPTAADIFKDSFIISKFRCKMVTKWGDNQVYDADSTSGYYAETEDMVQGSEQFTTYKAFNWVINNYLDIPDGMQRFEFQIQCYAPYRNSDGQIIGEDGIPVMDDNGRVLDGRENIKCRMDWINLNIYYCDVIVRRDLSNIMSSSITFDTEDENDSVTIHNVPVILKSYYDSVVADENRLQIDTTIKTYENNFELDVMQSLIDSIYFNDKKMLTDYINLKFADTYGQLVNLRYNQADYLVESRFWNTPWYDEKIEKISKVDYKFNEDYGSGSETDPKAKEGKSGIYYIVNGPLEEMKDKPLSSYIGYIALRLVSGDEVSGYTYTYQLFEPKIGMYVKVKDELDVDGYFKTLVWNGKIWKDIRDYEIPLVLKMKVEVDDTKISKSDDQIRMEIIEALTKYFQSKIGIQVNVDRSEIIRVCRSIPGIVYVDLLTPEFDIRFDYEIKDLTQKQLLDYTPQYVGFRGVSENEEDTDRSSVNIEIIRL